MQCNNSPMIRHHSFFKSVLLFAALSLPAAAFSSAADDKAFDSLHFNWKALRLADAIKEVRGDGARVIAVFTEPECGYCRKYEKTLAQVVNVTIYRFLMPLDPNRSRASETVWCAGDTDEQRLEALTVAMQNANLFPSMVIQMIGVGEATGDQKKLDAAVSELMAISGQKPVKTVAKKAIAGFKIRQGMPIGAMGTFAAAAAFQDAPAGTPAPEGNTQISRDERP